MDMAYLREMFKESAESDAETFNDSPSVENAMRDYDRCLDDAMRERYVAGAMDLLTDLENRIDAASEALLYMADRSKTEDNKKRLLRKAEGVRLVKSYLLDYKVEFGV